MATLHALLLLGKTFCFGYIHWTQQHDWKLVELSGKDNTVQIPQNIKPCSLVAMHIEKYYLEKNVCNQTFKIWKTLIYSNQSNPKPYKKTIKYRSKPDSPAILPLACKHVGRHRLR